MRPPRVLVAVLLALVIAAVAPPPTAYAGGPTSVLLVSPDRQRTTAAYVTDPVYAALTAALGEGRPGATEPAPTITDAAEEVRLTWLIHDVQIWRIDRVYLTTDDGVWVETVSDFGRDGAMKGRPGQWHRGTDPAGLVTVLATAGLLDGSGPVPVDAPPPDSTPTAAEAAAVTPAATGPGMLAAGLTGLAVGVAGALAAARAHRRTPTDRPTRVSLSG